MLETKIPILHALLSHLQKNPRAYHVPGHKMGRGIPGELGAWLGTAGRLDLTEIPGLDDLHAPEGAILEAQRLAANAFGAEETYFLINGSTAGNMAMIMAAVRPMEQILVPRNLHKSVLNGLILAQAVPVFYSPDVDEERGIPTGVRPEMIASALAEHPEVRAVLVVSPTYHGICSDLGAIAEIVHKAGIPLLVDEAHGAHFAFHPDLPQTAMEAGADLAVQSTHKMLGSLTQSSMLHLQGPRIDRVRLRKKLQLVQSTSPSYLLLASLDSTRHHMQTEGEPMLAKALQAARAGAQRLRETTGLQVLEQAGDYAVDPLKWTISVKELGITGPEAYQYLYEQHSLYLELSDPGNILAILSFADGELQAGRLIDGLTALKRWAEGEKGGLGSTPVDQAAEAHPLPPYGERQVPLHLAAEMDTEEVPLMEAAGRSAAEMVIPYPPGIPLLTPGEVWSTAMIDYVRHLKRTGVRFQGVDDATLETVRVLKR